MNLYYLYIDLFNIEFNQFVAYYVYVLGHAYTSIFVKIKQFIFASIYTSEILTF